jgi:DnaK suppressor protein
MRATELNKFKRILLDNRRKLTGTLTNMQNEALRPGNAGNNGDDVADYSSEQAEQELTLGLIATEQEEVFAIDAALERIDEKSYGKCRDCEVVIPKPRLEAVPTAERCVECQARGERFGFQTDEED